LCPAPGSPLEDHHFCGFGEPDVERALFESAHAASFLFSGEVQTDHYIYVPFYIPRALADTPKTRLQIRGTVVFDPPVSLDDSVDYSLCRIAGRLRKLGSNGLSDVTIGGKEDDALFPWNPLFQFRHSFRRPYAAGEWELRLRLMTRGDLPDDFRQAFSVVIEVIDESGRVNVRDAVTSEVQTFSSVTLRIAA
jgi:hypothetical protein